MAEISDIERVRKVRKVLLWVLLGNLGVAAAKIIYGFLSGSVSIKADGLHSLADSISNVVGLIAIAKTADEPDVEHPYGHRKLEVAGAIGIGFLIFLGLIEIGKTVFQADFDSHSLDIGIGGFAVVLFTLTVNLLITWREHVMGKRLNSPILLADARHTLSDCIATVGVLIAFIFSYFDMGKADIIIGGLIILLVGKAAWSIIRNAMDVLLDRARLDVKEIEKLVESISGVMDCHRVRSRGMSGAIFVDFHILVDSKLTVEEAHEITHKAETLVKEKYTEVVDVVIHTEPASDGREPYPWEKKS